MRSRVVVLLLVVPGKHKYRVKAFMVDRWYWRSYEGSAAVYLISIGVGSPSTCRAMVGSLSVSRCR